MNGTWMVRLTISCLILINLLLFFYVQKWFGTMLLIISHILWPVIAAWLLHYLFVPLIEQMKKRNVSAGWATGIVFLTISLCFMITVVNVLPIVIKQWNEWQTQMPDWSYRAQSFINDFRDQSNSTNMTKRLMDQLMMKMETKIGDEINRVIMNIPETINVFLLLFMIPFLIYYFVRDRGLWSKRFSSLFPLRWKERLENFFIELDLKMGDYIRGQSLVCVLVGVTSYVGYIITGTPDALLLAIFVAVLNVIPYVGPLIALVPAWMVAMNHSWSMVLSVTIVNFICQMIEGYIVSPWILSKSIEIHPLAIMIALLVSAEFGGIFGLIMAIPLLILFKISIFHFKMEKK